MKLAIISGASTGIGEAAAQLFIQQGFTVVNVSRRASSLEGIENLLTDLADDKAIDACIAALVPKIEAADSVALVHNAAYLIGDSAIEPNITELEKVLAINVMAPTKLNAGLLPVMPRSSSVIYIGSTLSEKAVAGSYSYVLSKHAVAGMMKATCQDLFGKGMHSACVCPGFTDTAMLREHINDDELRLQIGGNNAFERLVLPNEMAELIVWAHNNPIINGAMLHGNLGQKEY